MFPHILPKTENLLLYLENKRFTKIEDLSVRFCTTQNHFRTVPKLAYRTVRLPLNWGKNWETGWFVADFSLPDSLRREALFLKGILGGEGVLYLNNTLCGGLDDPHQTVQINRYLRSGKAQHAAAEVYAGHPLPGIAFKDRPSIVNSILRAEHQTDFPICATEFSLLRLNRPLHQLYYDVKLISELAAVLDPQSLRYHRLLRGLADIQNAVSLTENDPDKILSHCRTAQRIASSLLKAKNGTTTPRMAVMGHSHLDIAWLWPRAETTRKFSRTFSTVLNLMERYPEFRFIQTQAYIYDTVKHEYPALYQRITHAIRTGRWEPNAAMWVEADTNVSGGEALVRQFLYGKNLMKRELNARPDTLLLPDVFGYSAALPQIMALAEVPYFVTAKLGWNDTNKFPHSSFRWAGIDGTEVLAHFLLTGNYNVRLCPEDLKKLWESVTDKGVQDSQFVTFGYGDGGGGPSETAVEFGRRMKDVEGCPKVAYQSLSDYMKNLAGLRDQLPLYENELYLELHRGTLTAQSYTKFYNRKLEYALHDTELLCLLAHRQKATYPSAILEKKWKTVLTNQFHDIIPGSSIERVNVEAVAEYLEVEKTLEVLRTQALRKLSRPSPSDRISAINTLSHFRSDLIRLNGLSPQSRITDEDGQPLPQQHLLLNGKPASFIHHPIAPFSAHSFKLRKRQKEKNASPFRWEGKKLETPLYRVRFDDHFRIVSLIQKKTGRDIAGKAGILNDLRWSDDIAKYWMAWDIDMDYRFKEQSESRLDKVTLLSDGPLFIRLRLERPLARASRLTQDMIFYAYDNRIDFETRVDWNEKNVLLRTYFPTCVHTDEATFDIQFGHVRRATHNNSSREVAQFEVCGHKWADLSEADFGVALLNDCKYGYRVKEGELSLSLLRSNDRPDARCEKGIHRMLYALYPHAGNSDLSEVIRRGYELNQPTLTFPGNISFSPFLTQEKGDIIIESIKKAEQSDAAVIRLYAPLNKREKVCLVVPETVTEAYECNLLEDNKNRLTVRNNKLNLEFRPFEIKTLLLK